ncbi:hypothetical protein GCM10009817_02370 [Terrabacter lapilli]|uniref:Uncharacterized protein n=1 Tax=Terrabacter lapilli TaxID=436231 RepID=A0ABN2RB62_9MICO
MAVQGGWSRVPGGKQPGLLITPKLADARPCGSASIIDFARVSAVQAVALCVDGRIVRSTDGGLRWTQYTTATGGMALSVREDSGATSTYVARIADGCHGIEVSQAAEGSMTRVACVKAPLQGAEGRISLSVVDTGGWLLVAGQTWRSAADLAAWSPAA